MHGALHGLEVMGSIRKQVDQANKQHTSMASAPVSSSYPVLVPVLISLNDVEVQAK